MAEGEIPQEAVQSPPQEAVPPQSSNVAPAKDTFLGKVKRSFGKIFKGKKASQPTEAQPPENPPETG